MKKTEGGFTLIELLIVIAIVLMIGTFSTVFFSRFLTQSAVVDTQDRLLGQLRKAQMYAMTGKQNGSWGVRYGSHTITLFQGNSYATRNLAFDESFSENTNVAISGFSEVVFAKVTGLPSVVGTYTISGGDTSKSVVLNSQGVASK